MSNPPPSSPVTPSPPAAPSPPVTPSPPPLRPTPSTPHPPASVPGPGSFPPPPDVPFSPSPPQRRPPPSTPHPPASVPRPGSSPSPPDVPFSAPPPPRRSPPSSPRRPPAKVPGSSRPPPPRDVLSSHPPTSLTLPPLPGPALGVGLLVGALVLLLGLAAVLVACLVRKRRRRRRVPRTPEDFSYDRRQPTTPPLTQMATTFGYVELEAGTDGFSEANLLGQGGSGHVYRGTVRGREVAIRKLRAGCTGREFRAEVDIPSRVHHRNLVSLLGFCVHAQQRLLVYEYVPNSTLDSHLHHGTAVLDWPRRWKIAVGSAKGLAYLHHDCYPMIVHGDIKAANILLDYNYEPKVADFGRGNCQEIIEHTSAVSTRLMGTFGYLAPEYAASGKVTDRSDVFSFGVVLLELITGNKPIMTSSDHQPEALVSWAKPLLIKALEEGNYEELVDPRLGTNYDATEMTRLVHCAAAAIRRSARSRPRITQIVRYLELERELSAEDLSAGMHGAGPELDAVPVGRGRRYGRGEAAQEDGVQAGQNPAAATLQLELRIGLADTPPAGRQQGGRR